MDTNQLTAAINELDYDALGRDEYRQRASAFVEQWEVYLRETHAVSLNDTQADLLYAQACAGQGGYDEIEGRYIDLAVFVENVISAA